MISFSFSTIIIRCDQSTFSCEIYSCSLQFAEHFLSILSVLVSLSSFRGNSWRNCFLWAKFNSIASCCDTNSSFFPFSRCHLYSILARIEEKTHHRHDQVARLFHWNRLKEIQMSKNWNKNWTTIVRAKRSKKKLRISDSGRCVFRVDRSIQNERTF